MPIVKFWKYYILLDLLFCLVSKKFLAFRISFEGRDHILRKHFLLWILTKWNLTETSKKISNTKSCVNKKITNVIPPASTFLLPSILIRRIQTSEGSWYLWELGMGSELGRGVVRIVEWYMRKDCRDLKFLGWKMSEKRYDQDYEIIKGNMEWIFTIPNTRSKNFPVKWSDSRFNTNKGSTISHNA